MVCGGDNDNACLDHSQLGYSALPFSQPSIVHPCIPAMFAVVVVAQNMGQNNGIGLKTSYLYYVNVVKLSVIIFLQRSSLLLSVNR